ncbi:hypothetical protein XELAEV_18009478mg [Xenopus laevis]|uniref:Uncharacterized protein n=1 Tax=Xenopus laevis TaxID=8355 RepID=A0A974DSG6_XENLA|nr:hypothetical protein XELAEV_18009478mg [Xenopus laevis]
MPQQRIMGCCYGSVSLHTFRIGLRVWREGDVIKFAQAKPFPIHRDAELTQVDSLHSSLCYLVCSGGRHVALRRESRHDGSAGVITTHHTNRMKDKQGE